VKAKKKQSGSRICRAFSAIAILVITPYSFAQGKESWISSCYNTSLCHTVASIGGGIAIASNVGRSQTFPIVNPVTDEFFIYTANRPTQTVGAFDGFLGTEWTFHPKWALQLGLGFNQAWNFRAKGSLLQGADTQSADQYSYHYDILTRQLLIESKLLYLYKQHYHPYVLLGLGAAFNKATDYGTNVPPFLTFTRQYQNNTQTSFTYNVGAGIDVDILDHLRLGLGYRFADFGQIKLGNASIDKTSVSGTLSQTHLYASEILAQLTIVV
jgi:opacity protein-like surface antigen